MITRCAGGRLIQQALGPLVLTVGVNVHTRPIRRSTLGIALAAGALLLGACSSPDSTSATPTNAPFDLNSVQEDAAAAALVPADLASEGTVLIGTDASYAPSEFIDVDGKTIIGFDVDLGTAVGKVLGLDFKFENASFTGLIPKISNGTYGAGISSFTINPERLAQANMVSYFSAGTAWAVQEGNPTGITQDDACGKTVGVQTSTVQVDDLAARSATCKKANKPAIKVQSYEKQGDVTTALVSGKVDAMLADSPVTAYAIQQTSGKLEALGEITDAAPYGVVVAKDNKPFAEAIAKAYQVLIDSGDYQKILDKWGVGQGAIETSEVNPTP